MSQFSDILSTPDFADLDECRPYEACVGCGWCCLTDPCSLALQLHGHQDRCVELLWDESLRCYRCRLMRDPAWRDRARTSQHAGQGCCAPLNPWRTDVRNRESG